MLLSSIDVGSNSVRLLIGECADGRVSPVRYERISTRLASGIEKTGSLDDASAEKSIQALRDFTNIIKEYAVSAVKCVGTSALREAANADEFIRRVKIDTGLDLEVISGDKEAELTARGIISSFDGMGNCIIIDIGGGSTEWIVTRDGNIVHTGTLPVGVVKLHEKYIKSDPPSGAELGSLDTALDGHSDKIREDVAKYISGAAYSLIGTAGTATTIASIDLGLKRYDRNKVDMHGVKLNRLREIYSFLSSMPLDRRAKTPGLEPARADLIIPGILFTIKLMKGLRFDSITISAQGLLEGALIELSSEVPK